MLPAVVGDVGAAVLGVSLLGVALGARLFLAEAHGLDLCGRRAEERHHLLDRIGAALTQREVVLAAAALVGVALYRHSGLAVLRDVLRVRGDDGLELLFHDVAVVIEENAAS